jgi:flagellar basal body-associated protein FliL
VAALAGTRLELMPDIVRDGMRIEPLSKSVLKVAGIGIKEKTVSAEPESERSQAQTRVARKTALGDSGSVAPMLPMRPAEVRAQAALFEDRLTLPNERQQEDLAGAMKGEEAAAARWSSGRYVLVAVIAVLLVTVFTLYGMMHLESSGKRSATPAAAAPAVMLVSTADAGRSSGTVTAAGKEWRVIAYTFDLEEQAQRTAKEIAQRYPQLAPRVFALKGAAPWMVTLGGTMSRTEALVLREKAVSLGLPDDTYALKFR